MLGAQTLNTMQRNEDFLTRSFIAEHGPPGAPSTHNTLHVPRLVGKLSYSGTYTNTNLNAIYQSNSIPGSGSVEIALDSSFLGSNGNDIHGTYALVNANGDGPSTKPHIMGVDWTTGGFDSPQIHIKKLSSALGAGNSWVATHNTIDVAFFSLPFLPDAFPYLTSTDIDFAQGEGLRSADSSLANIRGLVKNQGLLRSHIDEGHTTGGVHDVVEVAKEIGTVTQSAGTYSLGADADFASINKLGTGQIEVTLSAAYTSTAKIHPFAQADYSSGSGSIVVNCRSYAYTPAGVIRVYIYEFDGTNWNYADADFFLAVFAN